MNKIELQKIDCNCNDCVFMNRDLDKFKLSLALHHKWSLDHFHTIKNNLLKKADRWLKRGYKDKHDTLCKEANNMKFQFNKKEVSINYGYCNKLDINVSFIPNTCQLETQKCFEHRKSPNNNG